MYNIQNVLNLLIKERQLKKESVWIITISDKNEIIHKYNIGVRNHNEDAYFYTEDIFDKIKLDKCKDFIFIHNHPTEDPLPSQIDKDTTYDLQNEALLNHYNLIDHIILSKDSYFSFLENNLFEKLTNKKVIYLQRRV